VAPTPAHALDRGVLRERQVGINFDHLAAAATTRAPLTLQLFADVAFVAVIDSVERRGGRALTAIGHLDGVEGSSVILVASEGVVAGSLTLPGAQYQIRSASDGAHVIREFDARQLPRELEPIVPDSSLMPPVEADAIAHDTGARFDLLVVWTPAARAAVGGAVAMGNLINLGVAETNQAYANSQIVARLRLVHMAEIAYVESTDLATDLSRLQGTSDGFMDAVHALRNQYGADMVQLVVDIGDGCGIAYLMAGNNPAFHPYAFSVTVRDCISPSYTLGHELGHNLGSNHEPDDRVGTGAFSYSFAHQVTSLGAALNYRTMMATNVGCDCSRVLNFSNPNVQHNGEPTGTTTRDNAQSINTVRVTAANWRQQVSLIVIESLAEVFQPGTSTPPEVGKPARFRALVRNAGPDPLGAGQRVWFLLERPDGGGDRFIGSASVAGLVNGASAWYAFDWVVPLDGVGVWQYWAITYDDAGREYTSAWRGPQAVTIVAQVYAYIESVTSGFGTASGGVTTLKALVRNRGSAALPADARVWFYVTGPNLANYVGSTSVGGLAPNEGGWYAREWQILPPSLVGTTLHYRASVWTGSTLISNISQTGYFMVETAAYPAILERLWPITNAMPGETVRFWAHVWNTRSTPATAEPHLEFRTMGDELGRVSLEGLAPFASAWYGWDYTIPSSGLPHARGYTVILDSPSIFPQTLTSYFTSGFVSPFTGSTAPWVPVTGTWSNASNEWYYTPGGASSGDFVSAQYPEGLFFNMEYRARLWQASDSPDAESCMVIRGDTQWVLEGRWWRGYEFCYRTDTTYHVYWTHDHVRTLLGEGVSTAINRGLAWNTLRVRAHDDHLTFVINGSEVWAGTHNYIDRGRVGILRLGTGPLWVDDVVLTPTDVWDTTALDATDRKPPK
jgi:hypothetical protein